MPCGCARSARSRKPCSKSAGATAATCNPEEIPIPLARIGVIGAGTMGNGIAQVCAAAGLSAVMVDISDAALSRGMASMASSLDRLVKKDKMSAADRDALLGRVRTSTDYAELHAADLVIEAAT